MGRKAINGPNRHLSDEGRGKWTKGGVLQMLEH